VPKPRRFLEKGQAALDFAKAARLSLASECPAPAK
jgi:hypothetical protein